MTANRALIIVDVQPTFCEGGALAVEGGNAVAERIADFVTENADEYSFIVTTQDWHVDPGEHFSDNPDFVDTWPPHGVAGTPEAELHEAVASLPFDDSVKKGEYAAAYSGFEGVNRDGEPLERLLREQEITSVDVVGIAESHCIKETALDSLKAGFPTRVLSDLTVPVSEELGESARTEMDEAGVEQIKSAEAFGFYDGDEDDVPLIADEWDESFGDEDSFGDSEGFGDDEFGDDEFGSDDSGYGDGYGSSSFGGGRDGGDDYDSDWDDTNGDGIPDDLEDDELGAADYREFELPKADDPGVIRTAPEFDEFGDEDGAELDGAVTEDSVTATVAAEEDLSELDLDDFDLDDVDLDADFSDEVSEEDFNFDDLR